MPSFSSSIHHESEPAWDVARLFPPQGLWSEADYMDLTERTNRLVEFTDGCIEVLEMPTQAHQFLVRFLVDAMRAFVEPRHLGEVLFAPLRVRISANKFREPDVVFMRNHHADRRKEDFWEGADLVMEVISKDPESRRRDMEVKRSDYAEARIPEYWIVDPAEMRVTVLALVGEAYAVHGEFGVDEQATSLLLPGFAVKVAKLFKAADV